MSDILILLGFLGVYTLIGGWIVGTSLRQGIRQNWSPRVMRRLFGSIGFGGLPLILDLALFPRLGAPYLVLVAFLLFASAFLGAVLVQDSIVEMLAPILAGGFLVVMGVILFQVLAGDSLLYALLALAGFVALGGYVFVTSLLKALNG